MTLEAIKCRLLLHYSYTLAEKACKYGKFCFYNINVDTKPTSHSEKETAFFKVLRYIFVPIVVSVIGCIGYIISAMTREDPPRPTSTPTILLTPTPEPTPTLEASCTPSPEESMGVFEVADSDGIFNPVTFCLTSESKIADELFEESLRIIRTRLDAMGSPYAIEIDEQGIWITAARNAFGENEIEVGLTKYILAYQGGACVGSKRLGKQIIGSSDIQSKRVYKVVSEQEHESQGYGLELILASSGARKTIEIAKDIQKNGDGTIELGMVKFESQCIRAAVTGTDVQISFGDEQESIISLVAEVISGQPLPSAFLVDSREAPLLYYHETKKLPENKVCFSFIKEFETENEEDVPSKNASEETIRTLRYRMNALGFPFLVKVNNNEIIVETAPDHIGYDVIRLLGKKKTVELYPAVGPMILNMEDISHMYATSDGFELSLTDDGCDKLLLSAYRSDNTSEVSDYYLAINKVVVSRLTISTSALKQILDDKYFGTLEFSKLLIHEQPEIDDENWFLIELCNAIFNDNYQMPYNLTLNKLWLGDEPGESADGVLGQQRMLFPDQMKVKGAVRAIVPDALFSQAYNEDLLYIGLLLEPDSELPIQFVNTALEVLESVQFEKYLFQDIIFYLAGVDSHQGEIKLLFTKTSEADGIKSLGPYTTGNLDEQFGEELYSLFMEHMSQYAYSFMIMD